jgi:hypothetical protein
MWISFREYLDNILKSARRATRSAASSKSAGHNSQNFVVSVLITLCMLRYVRLVQRSVYLVNIG